MGRAEERRARQRGGARRAAPAPATGHRAEGGRADRRKSKDDRGFIRRMFTWKKILGAFFGVVLLCMGAFVVLYMIIDVPDGNNQAKLQSNVFKYSDGSVMARTGDVNREIVDLSELTPEVQRSFVAAENKSFYTDKGVDLKGTARGLFNTLSGKGKQGGSTITQQYVKNYYLTQDQTVTRKLKELVISLKVERQYSKEEILAGYINTSYYGRGAWGIQAAAQAYYGIDASKLSPNQGAYLAALLQAPSQYDYSSATPTGKKLVKARWNYVLDNMVEMHWLDAGKRKDYTFPTPHKPKAASGLTGQEGYLYEAAKAEAIKDLDIPKEKFDAGGYTITLNIDRKKQQQLEKSVKDQLTDKLDTKHSKTDADVQAGAVSVDPKTGKVLAMYGGEGYPGHYTNNATRADYQPASTFKPIILAAALADGAENESGQQIKASTSYDGTSKRPVEEGGTKVGFAPPNEDDQDYGPVTVQTAMNKSINSVFAQMGADVGMDKVMETAKALGMNSDDLKPYYAQTLGTMGASPLEMAGVYATLDNHGKKVTPKLLKSVSYGGSKESLPDAIGSQVLEHGVADSVTSVLTGVVDDGTAKASVRDNPARDGQQVAGKTGTSDCNRSAWFTGYTPDLVTSVGLFGEAAGKRTLSCDDKKTPVGKGGQVSLSGAAGGGRVNGGAFPAQIWAQYTFNATGSSGKFSLDTDMGAGVKPTTSAPVTPSDTPSQTPSQTPTTKAPSQTPTTPSQEPTTQTPTQTPTTEEPPPSDSPTIEIPENPVNGREEQ
ncbi:MULTISPECIES: transglycosylase domain-containing protein [unclassified Streptomyces]|uniref:transglycosylase domain-containing protein n=1 Tax=unclassified Streptomyces TaxID=2593676 RepID=UPI000DB9A733|nr:MULTISPECIES: transglycosylase domain-containing protein [unclassified Streptomyces]MYT68838.1 penicillin-binding protein [Streptomyces sp. SID8367]